MSPNAGGGGGGGVCVCVGGGGGTMNNSKCLFRIIVCRSVLP